MWLVATVLDIEALDCELLEGKDHVSYLVVESLDLGWYPGKSLNE